MSDPIVTSAASPEQQAKAEKLGWIPAARFKGDPERFVDADEYIERGETVLPIIKETNKRLQSELAELRGKATATEAALKSATDAIQAIEERHTVETQKAVERAKLQVKLQLSEASAAGDHEGVAELTEQMVKLNATEVKPAEKKVPVQAAPAAFVPLPDLAAWNAENPWFGTDRRKTALAIGIAQDLREAGETSVGRAFFEKVKIELDTMLGGGTAQEPASKVEGGRVGSELDAPRGGAGGKTFNALPKEAKDACDADAKRFVGPNKRYKTNAEWRTRYAEIYFEGS